MHQVNNTEELKIESTVYFYYTGFKKGLTTLLSQIHQENDKYAILIHGIPRMGKTSLAHNLAYHLASGGSTAMVVTMDNGQIFSPETVTENLSSFCGESGWVIFDQVNVHSLDQEILAQELVGSERKTPLIVFTSGHNAPPGPSWTKGPVFCMKVIDMRVDEAGVDSLKKYWKNDKVQTRDVLQVTSVFGHVFHIVYSTLYEDALVSLPALHEEVYEDTELSALFARKPTLLWMLWPEFCNARAEDVAERNKLEDWKIEPSKVQLLDYVLSQEKDPLNIKTRLFVNWLQIDGNSRCDENQHDGFYEHTEYFYYFPSLEKLHASLRKAHQVSPEEKLRKMIDIYNEFNDQPDSNARSVQSHVFEGIIRLQCKLHVKSPKAKYGLVMDGKRGVALVEVDDILKPRTVEDLCKIVEEKRRANREREQYWCDLNAGNSQFPGYNFAYVQMENGKYFTFQLFQATVNARKHKSGTMVSVLQDIEEKLYTPERFEGNARVIPFFLCPYDEDRGTKEYMTLEHNCQAQIINMIEF